MYFAEKVADVAAESTAVQDVVEIVTQYSDKRVPTLNFVMIPLSMIVLIAALIAGFVILRNRTRNWGTGLISGITAYLLLSVVCAGLVSAVGLIGPLREFFSEKQIALNLIVGVVSLIVEALVLYYGMVYARFQHQKRNQKMDIGTALAFGMGFYAVMVILGNQITTLFTEYINCQWVNSVGFDKMISSMVETGEYAEDAAIAAVLQLVNTNGFNYLLDVLSTIMVSVQITCVAVIFYGTLTEKLERKRRIYGVGFVALSNVQSFAAIFTENMVILFVIGLVVTAVILYVTIRLVKENMQDDVHQLTYTRKMQERDEKEQKKKMPKIVMPKD